MWFSAPESVEITFNARLIEFIRSIVQGRVWAVDLAGSVLCSGTRLHSDLVLCSTSKNSLSVPLYMLSVLWLLWEGCQGKAYLSFMWSDPHWKEHSCTGQGTTRYANSYIELMLWKHQQNLQPPFQDPPPASNVWSEPERKLRRKSLVTYLLAVFMLLTLWTGRKPTRVCYLPVTLYVIPLYKAAWVAMWGQF